MVNELFSVKRKMESCSWSNGPGKYERTAFYEMHNISNYIIPDPSVVILNGRGMVTNPESLFPGAKTYASALMKSVNMAINVVRENMRLLERLRVVRQCFIKSIQGRKAQRMEREIEGKSTDGGHDYMIKKLEECVNAIDNVWF